MLNPLRNLFTKRSTRNSVIPDIAVPVSTIEVARQEYFPNAGPTPWLDRPDALSAIESLVAEHNLTAEQAELCRKWVNDGYLILKKFFSQEQIDNAWTAYEHGIATGIIVPPTAPPSECLPERTLNPHFKLTEVRELLFDERMVGLIGLLLGVDPLPFQTIMSHRGSEQKTHSDSIHMSTYPWGYLIANWISFEKIHDDSGPLVFYPGSHRLEYATAKKVGIELEEGRTSYDAYHAKYEPYIERVIAEKQLIPSYFEAEKGDVLLWHANLLHGGSPRRDRSWSRKALVCHYFAEGCICYHDYTGMLSHFHITSSEKTKRGLRRWINKIRNDQSTSNAISPNEFDANAYLDANPDVEEAGVDPYEHYIKHGLKEKRKLRL